jgi:hypothetical protein
MSSKRRKYKGQFELLSDPVTHREISFVVKDKSVKRAKKENGWRCPYCGAKFVKVSYWQKFTLSEHLKQSKGCAKDHEREQSERSKRKSSPLERSDRDD